jgi:hypothetical protein
LIFIPALLIYVTFLEQLRDMVRMRTLYLNIGLILAVCTGYYIVREHFDPGYLNGRGDPFYVAPTNFYVKALRSVGYSIFISPSTAEIPSDVSLLVICGNSLPEAVASKVNLEKVVTNGECDISRIHRNTGFTK